MPFVPVNVEGQGTDASLTTSSPARATGKVESAPHPEAVLWDQPLSTVNQGAYVDQDFPDYPTYSSFLADDFVNADLWSISTIFVPGDGWNGFSSLLNATALTWQIYADNAGVPAGDPSGGGSPPVWTLTLAPTDPQVVISTGTPGGTLSNATLNLAAPLNLPAGHWWLVFYPTMSFGSYGQYGRQPADTTSGYTGQLINPGGGFGYGTVWQPWTVLGPTQTDMAFRLEGAVGQPPVVAQVENWDPARLALLDWQVSGGEVVTETGRLEWTAEVTAPRTITLTKWFHVEPCTWTETTLVEELWLDQVELEPQRPVVVNKVPSELWIDAAYEPAVTSGLPATFTLIYSNTGGYENNTGIYNNFPPEAPFVSSTPPPALVSPDHLYVQWDVGDLPQGAFGSIDVTVDITHNLPPSTTIEIWDYIFDHALQPHDAVSITFHVESPVVWDKYVDGIPWTAGMSVTRQTSDTIEVVEVLHLLQPPTVVMKPAVEPAHPARSQPAASLPPAQAHADGTTSAGQPAWGVYANGIASDSLVPTPPQSALTAIAPPPGAIVINFDDAAAPCLFMNTTALRDQYAGLGVLFMGPAVNDGGGAVDQCGSWGVSGHSPPNFLGFNPDAHLSDGGIPRPPEIITFTNGASYVQVNAGSGAGAGQLVTMEAFDAAGNSLGSDSLTLAPTLDTLSITANRIAYVVINSPAYFVLDDLAFVGSGQGPIVSQIENWDPAHLQLVDWQVSAGEVVTETGRLVWSDELVAPTTITLTKWFHVEPCTWTQTTLLEELWLDQVELEPQRPVVVNKAPSELWIDAQYEPAVTSGLPATFTLVYSNTGGYESGVVIYNNFPARGAVPQLRSAAHDGHSRPPVRSVEPRRPGAGRHGQYRRHGHDPAHSLPPSTTIEIWDYIFDHTVQPRDAVSITFHVESPVVWDKSVDGVAWTPGMTITRQTSDTITVVEVLHLLQPPAPAGRKPADPTPPEGGWVIQPALDLITDESPAAPSAMPEATWAMPRSRAVG